MLTVEIACARVDETRKRCSSERNAEAAKLERLSDCFTDCKESTRCGVERRHTGHSVELFSLELP